ncbi:hypothetical protein OESDEN_16101 [Oesophagostomum dentatum]|uniref:Saposin B-type domain-containing protein n=1 Tax=Oesophagostomum dentatum TaxID=61180 RepID=A0A0B1SH05_OESDE|nr:hypothetical protein OESDEN_16101 [Oesophagostomum dentatum]
MKKIVFLATLFSISSTLVANEEEEENDCKWICEGLLSDYNDLVNSDAKDNLTAITEELADACSKDIDFAKFVKDPIDTACPEFCEKFIPVILKDEKLKSNLLQEPTAYAETMDEFCGRYDYSARK